MTPERQYAVSVAVGLTVFAGCLALDASGVVSVASGVVYTALTYYAAEHPDLLWKREGRSWTSGVVAGVTTFGLVSLLQAEPGAGVVVLVFGLTYFGFAAGIAFARES